MIDRYQFSTRGNLRCYVNFQRNILNAIQHKINNFHQSTGSEL